MSVLDPVPTLRWVESPTARLMLLDQTRLPSEIVVLECRSPSDVHQAIRRLAVRGAPAIGVAAAYGVCLALDDEGPTLDAQEARRRTLDACDALATSRPTAVNLFWALDRMRAAIELAATLPPLELRRRLVAQARAIEALDRASCTAIGHHGADRLDHLPVGVNLLTHCNAGALATTGDGTALAVIFELARRGKRPHVWVDETRPLLQGARLTAWELQQRGVDCTLICDSMAAVVMQQGRVHVVITGADRIAANGDAANKVGTYGLALLASAHDVPFYIAAPCSTIDASLDDGGQIPIEQRPENEISMGFGLSTTPQGTRCFNPAFDVTPARCIHGLITDVGIIEPVVRDGVLAALSRHTSLSGGESPRTLPAMPHGSP